MSLESWVEYGWLKAEPSSREEIADLLGIVSRGLSDAKADAISDDVRFQARIQCGAYDREYCA